MKILVISDIYFPRESEISASIRNLLHEMASRGHEVRLIAPDYGMSTEDESWIIRAPSGALPGGQEEHYMLAGPVLREADNLRGEKFDIIHIMTPFMAHYLGSMLSGLFGIPRVETYTGLFERKFKGCLPESLVFFLQPRAHTLPPNSYHAVDGWVVQNENSLEMLKSVGVAAPMEVIRPDVDREALVLGNGARFREKHGISPERPIILYVGRIALEKNIGFLLRVTARIKQVMPDVLLLVRVDGADLARVEGAASAFDLGGSVRIVRCMEKSPELFDCYQASDVLMYTPDCETNGMALLEAMAQKLPVISTPLKGAAAGMLKNCKGILVHREDESDFSSNVVRLLRERNLRLLLGELGRRYVLKEYTATEKVSRLLDFYRRVISVVAQKPLLTEPYKTEACQLQQGQHVSHESDDHMTNAINVQCTSFEGHCFRE